MRQLISASILTATLLASTGMADLAPNIQLASVHAAEAGNDATAQAAKAQNKKKRRRTPALGSRVYSQLARAQQLADGGDVAAGLEVLDEVKSKASSLNSYEKAMMYNFYGFIFYNAERVDEALAAFEQVVAQQPIPESLEKSTLFSLSQLAMANGEYERTLAYLTRWETVDGGEVPAKNQVLKAQASYQNKDYQSAAKYIETAISTQSNGGFKVEENWYVLQRAIYFELKQPEKVTQVLETMVRLFDKPEYWLQLAGMYGELGEEQKQLAVLEAAYQQGYVTKKSDYRNLAQIYYLHGLPYKAATVMEQGFAKSILPKSDKNLTFLAQALVAAKEFARAIESYRLLSNQTADGQADQQIAELYLQLGEFEKVVDAGKRALHKDGLANPGNLYLALGMASFNLKQFDDALDAFNQAVKIKSSKKMASQWLKFVQREKVRLNELARS